MNGRKWKQTDGWLGTFDVGSQAVSVRVWTWVKAVREGSLELELSSQEPLQERNDNKYASNACDGANPCRIISRLIYILQLRVDAATHLPPLGFKLRMRRAGMCGSRLFTSEL